MKFWVMGKREKERRVRNYLQKRVITTTKEKKNCIFMDGGEGGMGIEENREIIGTWN